MNAIASTRRNFLKIGLAAGGGMMVGLRMPGRAKADPLPAGAPFAPNAFIRITPDNQITFLMSHTEVGQGVYTSASMLIAEELEVGLEQIQLEHAPPTRHFTPTRCSASRRPVAAPRPAPVFCRCARPGLPHV